jgi:hypothetical protein
MGKKKTTTRKMSNKQEKRLEKKYGFKQNPNSGNCLGWAGDNQDENWLVEAKTTGKLWYSVKVETMEKIEREAAVVGKLPVLVVCLGERKEREYVVLTKEGVDELWGEDLSWKVKEYTGKSFRIEEDSDILAFLGMKDAIRYVGMMDLYVTRITDFDRQNKRMKVRRNG